MTSNTNEKNSADRGGGRDLEKTKVLAFTSAADTGAEEALERDRTENWEALAIGAHPDDVELGCGGTLAKLAAAGRRIGILHLSRGERGTRGTFEERLAEAGAAALALGARGVEFLDCGDGGMRTGEAEEDALIEVIRRRRPEVIFAPAPADRHPDHGRAHRLVEAAAFYSGLRRRAPGAGQPFRPGALFSYMQHDPFEPRFVVDVTRSWSRKLAALAAYDTQLYQGEREGSLSGGPQRSAGGSPRGARRDDAERAEPPTKVASREFAAAVEGRARHYGLLIGAEFGEPFWTRLPLAVGNPLDVVPGGIR